jgi:hypothetical protein
VKVSVVVMCEKLPWKSWKLYSLSSEEADGEGPDNGRAACAIDGKSNTFWHSQWCGRTAQYPHFLVIDLGEVLEVDRVCFTQRQSLCRAVNKIEVYAGRDCDDLQLIESYMLQEVKGSQMFEFPISQTMQFLKILALSSWDNEQFAALSKISVYRNRIEGGQCKAFPLSGMSACLPKLIQSVISRVGTR